jgi:hypothetical protein
MCAALELLFSAPPVEHIGNLLENNEISSEEPFGKMILKKFVPTTTVSRRHCATSNPPFF